MFQWLSATVRTQFSQKSGIGRGGELAAAFPYFCQWIHELQPETIPAEELQRVADRLTPIILRQLPDPDDFQDCRTDVFLFMEKKLSGPMEFAIRMLRNGPDRPKTQPTAVKSLHLLRAERFEVLAHHEDFLPSQKFLARLAVVAGTDRASLFELSSGGDGRVRIVFAYEALQHEQVVVLDLLPQPQSASGYYHYVKAVRHSTFDIRMGFVVETARLVARNRAWKERESRKNEVLMDDMSAIPSPETGAAGHSADTLARKAVRRLSPELREQLHLHYVGGVPWTAIADRYGAREEVLRKKASRALHEVAESIVAQHPDATRGATERVVKWLYETLPRIWQRG